MTRGEAGGGGGRFAGGPTAVSNHGPHHRIGGMGGSGGGGGSNPGNGGQNGANNPNNHQKAPRPSDERRKLLSLADGKTSSDPRISNLCPITRYYDIAERLLLSFHGAYEAKNLNDAYVLGKRFARFSLTALPHHDYYNSPNRDLARLREQNRIDATRVVEQLEDIARWMDEEEAEKQRLHREKVARLLKEKEKQRQLDMQKRAEEKLRLLQLRGRPAEEKKKEEEVVSTTTGGTGGKRSKSPLRGAMKKISPSKKKDKKKQDEGEGSEMGGGASQAPSPSASVVTDDDGFLLPPLGEETPQPPPPPSYADIMKSPATAAGTSMNRVGMPTTSTSLYPAITDMMPSPSWEPMPPPSEYEAFDRFAESFRNNLEMEIGTSTDQLMVPIPCPPSDDSMGGIIMPPPPPYPGLPSHPSSVPSVSTTTPPKPKTEGQGPSPEDRPIPINDVMRKYRLDYVDAKKKKQVEIFELHTYQGRNSGAGRDSTNGCAVISPLVVVRHLETPGTASVSDMAIEDVIDRQAPPVLSQVRKKLGLGSAALIIPSDVHDQLVDKKILKQEQFVGACGGNILDPAHLGELLKMLEHGFDVSHCGNNNNKNNNNGDDECRKKKVGAALFFHEHVISIVKIIRGNNNGGEEPWYDLVDSMPNNGKSNATRIRCKGIASLETLLRYYACNKFSDADVSYIDGNVWDDALCDFDPRVFQAFVWAQQ